MGYSLYYEQIGEAPDEGQWGEIEAAAHQICDKYKDILCLEFDEPHKSPQISEDIIIFNGKGEDGHETFVLQPQMQGFNFCKTAHKPYTAAVKEILAAVDQIAPNWLRISDDDGWKPYL